MLAIPEVTHPWPTGRAKAPLPSYFLEGPSLRLYGTVSRIALLLLSRAQTVRVCDRIDQVRDNSPCAKNN